MYLAVLEKVRVTGNTWQKCRFKLMSVIKVLAERTSCERERSRGAQNIWEENEWPFKKKRQSESVWDQSDIWGWSDLMETIWSQKPQHIQPCMNVNKCAMCTSHGKAQERSWAGQHDFSCFLVWLLCPSSGHCLIQKKSHRLRNHRMVCVERHLKDYLFSTLCCKAQSGEHRDPRGAVSWSWGHLHLCFCSQA